jgi:type IV secretion system protein VirD4
MVSRAETARPLLTAGEVMQLPPTDEIVMISGVHPVRAKKVRYFEDRRFAERIVPPLAPVAARGAPKPDDWSALPLPPRLEVVEGEDQAKTPVDAAKPDDDPANGSLRREPGLERHKDIAPPARPMEDEFGAGADKANGVAPCARTMTRIMQRLARQISLDPDDDMDM